MAMTAGGSPQRTTPTVSSRYDKALAFLYGFSDMERGIGWSARSDPRLEWNLRRTRLLLDLAGSPDRRMVCVLVAGTKGKGSTAAMLAAILSASGIQTGLFTKPHLQSYRERVRVDGVAIGEAAFADLVDALAPQVDTLRERVSAVGAPTTFELTVALALAHFAQERCTVAVLEVGLGGRYDATNAVDPHVSVITPISHDHVKELGHRLADIAREKAGVLRPGRVAILAPQVASARAALRVACARVGADPRQIAPLSVRAAANYGLALRGPHQRTNAAAAIAAAQALAEHGIALHEHAIGTALRSIRWPGRFEVLAGPPTIVLDGAHNDGSAEALSATLRGEFPRRKITFVLGLMREKDARAVLAPLLPLARAVHVTAPPGPRALPAEDLARLVRHVPVHVHSDATTALTAARAEARRNEVICVTGSLALVGAARDALGLPFAERLWDA